jgi:hypothetical protein
MKNAVTPRGSYKNRRFGETYCLHNQVERIRELRAMLVEIRKWSALHLDDGGDTFLWNVCYNKSHGVTSQKTAFFIATAVKPQILWIDSIFSMYPGWISRVINHNSTCSNTLSLLNPSCRIMTLGLSQPVPGMCTRILLGVQSIRRVMLTALPPSLSRPSRKCGTLDISQHYTLPLSVILIAILLFLLLLLYLGAIWTDNTIKWQKYFVKLRFSWQ